MLISAFRLLFVFAIAALSLSAQLPLRFGDTGAAPDSRMGNAVAALGDIDGDGCDDFAVASQGVFSLPPFFTGPAGRVDVYSGKTGAVINTFTRPSAPLDPYGISLAALDDVDGDGRRDLAIGWDNSAALGGGTSVAGSVDVVSTGTGAILGTIVGTTPGGRLGRAVASLGDIDGDGAGDFLASSNQFPISGVPSVGRVAVVSGASLGVIQNLSQGGDNDFFGDAIAGLGDITGDGVPDYIVGAPGATPVGSLAGAAYVYSGATHAVIRSYAGTLPNVRLGSDVANVGDVNGNGVTDYAIGESGYRLSPTVFNSGRVCVYEGATGALLFTILGENTGEFLGDRISGGGDLNGDGLTEVATTYSGEAVQTFPFLPPTVTRAGGVRVVSTVGELGRFDDGFTDTRLGEGMDFVGDVDGDGIGELVLGNPEAASNAGRFRVVTLAGRARYGVDPSDPIQTLDLDWTPGGTVLPSGRVIVSGAASLAAGIIGVSTGPADFPFMGFRGLIDPTPGAFFLVNFTFDVNGDVSFPTNLATPAIAGQSFFVQALEIDPMSPAGVWASAGLNLLMAP